MPEAAEDCKNVFQRFFLETVFVGEVLSIVSGKPLNGLFGLKFFSDAPSEVQPREGRNDV